MGSRIMNTLRMSGMASGPFVLKKLFATKTSSRISWMLECEDRKVSEEGIRGWVTCLNANHDIFPNTVKTIQHMSSNRCNPLLEMF